PANIRIVHSFERYIEAYGPRAYGYSPGKSPSSGPYTGCTVRPESVVKSASPSGAPANACSQSSRPVIGPGYPSLVQGETRPRGANCPVPAVTPPSTGSSAPVMNDASDDTRNAWAAATSPGRPHRRSGT